MVQQLLSGDHKHSKEYEMSTGDKTTGVDARAKLSTLWVFATLNYLYCDVLALMDSKIRLLYFL